MNTASIKIFAARLLLFIFLWAVVSGTDFDEPFMVAVIILLATATSIHVWPKGYWSFRPIGWLRFLPYFLWHSLLGGWDVAKRALSLSMPLAPAVIEFDTDTSELQKVLLGLTISLLPGTACIAVDGQKLIIHVLDRRLQVELAIRALESKIKACC